MARLEALGLHASDSAFAVRFDVQSAEGGKHTVTLDTQSGQGAIRYTLDGRAPTADSLIYDTPLTLGDDAVVRAAAFYEAMPYLTHASKSSIGPVACSGTRMSSHFAVPS
ncbi:chitobiase/beta-hexosaminidase C-terminal domain-containing protein [Kordiimonas gwangyangensis]|uniref:chitobiase/beta-hexosaminidase C-terminal domain-containing protein n=1 Tax=Kordiimonas gwangyangensis TaxID=288022 RepID=UPI0034E2BBDE